MFKRELLQHILPIPDVSFHDIWIAFVASSLGTIGYTDEAMIYYRRHDNQVTNTKKNKGAEIRRTLNDFIAYRTFSEKINDHTMLSILNPLIDHYRNYDDIFINFALRKQLIQHRDELFAICPPNKRLRYAKKNACGQKFHTVTLPFR